MKISSPQTHVSINSAPSRFYPTVLAFALACFGLLWAPGGVFADAVPNGYWSGNLTAFLEGTADFDGDGRTGAAEDSDGDNVFGSISAIPGFDQPTGIIGPRSVYNHVVVVTSGVFRESIRTTATFAVDYTIEAAPGVIAVFDISDTNGIPPELPPSPVNVSTVVTLRNLTFRNFSNVIQVAAGGTLLVEDCRFEDCGIGYAIVVERGGRAVVRGCTITRCGDKRSGLGGGIRVLAGTDVIVSNCTITGNFGVGVERKDKRLRLINSLVAHNNPNIRD